MRRLNLAAVLGSVMVGVVAVGCGGDEDAGDESVATVAPTVQIRSLLSNKGDSRLVATIRGPGQIGYLTPVTSRDGNEIVTTFRIKNVSRGALAGFSVKEFWYDDDGETVTGDAYRMPRPFLQNQVIEVELRVPRNSRMSTNRPSVYDFSHQNGVVEATLFEEMEEPTPLEEEDAEASDEGETPAR